MLRKKKDGSARYQAILDWATPAAAKKQIKPKIPPPSSTSSKKTDGYSFDLDSDEERDDTMSEEWHQRELHHERIFHYLRKNNWDALTDYVAKKEQPWRALLFKSYVQKCKKIAENGTCLEEDMKKTWSLACERLVADASLGEYGKAVYGLMMGDVNYVLPVCDSWESVVWAYYHTEMHGNTTRSLEECLAVAKEKDMSVAQSDPTLAFSHDIQTLALIGRLDLLCHDPDYLQKYTWNDKQERQLLRRFLALVVIYARTCLALDTERHSAGDALVADYADLFRQASFQPAFVALYASFLRHDKQIEYFAQFLFDFDGDEEETRILVDLGYQHQLDMPNVLRRVFKKTMGPQATEGEDQVARYQQGLSWLLMEDQLLGDVIKTSNKLIRQLLQQDAFDLVDKVLAMLTTLADTDLPSYPGGNEHLGHIRLAQSHRLYTSWEPLLQQEPTPINEQDLDGYKRLSQWKSSLSAKTDQLEQVLLSFLRSPWLPTTDPAAKDYQAIHCLRTKYRPSLFLQLHHILYETRSLASDYDEKCALLINLLANSKYQLYQDLVDTGRLSECLSILCKNK
ncbi:hypothetical protein DM01DRAFT_1338168 [Hesseltinella vesiculosa]|uniref:Nuclear pore complex protein n=1 Tax=Hesseltinella vesiculosa TaxID=101127 RepID=A0A1X2GAV9_9FUNG|nr:hypothetical protein DM01DRAFT_1338168 [Hesseltinella vesiculosa]